MNWNYFSNRWMRFGLRNSIEKLAAKGLIRHVISRVWNKDQHRLTMVFEYESQNAFKTCEKLLAEAFKPENCPAISRFVFKIFNNRGVIVSEFIR